MTKIKFPDAHHDIFSNTIFGFWLYLMTDAILFVTLFATYAVLHNSTYGGPTSRDIIDLNSVLIETLVLLVSSFTCGLAMLAASHKDKTKMLAWFTLTFVLGAAFLTMEVADFRDLIRAGNGWQRSAFLSAYFTLVGTHGLHIAAGLFFLLIFLTQFAAQGFSPPVLRRFTCFSMFWYFSYVVWIFMFTLVYLMGVI
jgi:cytochrome o ubiquinol oxidase subunit 3